MLDLHWLLADKAYLSEEIVGGPAERGLKAIIPIFNEMAVILQFGSSQPSAVWFESPGLSW